MEVTAISYQQTAFSFSGVNSTGSVILGGSRISRFQGFMDYPFSRVMTEWVA